MKNDIFLQWKLLGWLVIQLKDVFETKIQIWKFVQCKIKPCKRWAIRKWERKEEKSIFESKYAEWTKYIKKNNTHSYITL